MGVLTHETLHKDMVGGGFVGHLSGCEFTGDWWVRAMPMFGPPGEAWAYDGHIRSNGDFTLGGKMPGVRHMLVVGKGKQAIKVVALDVAVGITRNDAGNIELGGTCPQ